MSRRLRRLAKAEGSECYQFFIRTQESPPRQCLLVIRTARPVAGLLPDTSAPAGASDPRSPPLALQAAWPTVRAVNLDEPSTVRGHSSLASLWIRSTSAEQRYFKVFHLPSSPDKVPWITLRSNVVRVPVDQAGFHGRYPVHPKRYLFCGHGGALSPPG